MADALQVSEELLTAEGAGSEAVARRMATAVRIRCGATLGLAVSDVSEDESTSRLTLAWDDGRTSDVKGMTVTGLGSAGREWACQVGLDGLWRYAVKRQYYPK